MSLEKELQTRSGGQCEFCSSTKNLTVYELPNAKDLSLFACSNCVEQMTDTEKIESNQWRFLNDTIWSEHDAVKVMSWRMLNRIHEDWSQDLLNMMYMDEVLLEMAKAAGDGEADENQIIHRDVNGVILDHGDSVVLIKDLKVKGTSMVAKQGTAVRNIRLDRDNVDYIEGKVDGQQIVIITQYVKKL